MIRSARAVLGQDKVDAYHRDGFVVPNYRLPDKDIAHLQAPHAEAGRGECRSDRPTYGWPPHPRQRHSNLKSTQGWLDIATHPDIVDMIEEIMGPDIILWGSGIFYKRALAGPATPWHRDAQHTPIKPLATTTAWIAVFDSVIANSCLRFIPGSHAPREIGTHTWTATTSSSATR